MRLEEAVEKLKLLSEYITKDRGYSPDIDFNDDTISIDDECVYLWLSQYRTQYCTDGVKCWKE